VDFLEHRQHGASDIAYGRNDDEADDAGNQGVFDSRGAARIAREAA
jgi:hypothetical protein